MWALSADDILDDDVDVIDDDDLLDEEDLKKPDPESLKCTLVNQCVEYCLPVQHQLLLKVTN